MVDFCGCGRPFALSPADGNLYPILAPTVSLDGSGPGGIRSAWSEVANREQGGSRGLQEKSS